nr:dTDP-4-dehydrorhamnose reductase [uncultured Steroidobacter sp.]
MKVLITGAQGQLGQALVRTPADGIDVIAVTSKECDIVHEASLQRCLDTARPQVLINAAAYTAVDQAESERDRAFAVNAAAVANLAAACRDRAIKLVHISTDFVFDGAMGRPYRPDDVVRPLSVYGESKAEGERRIAQTPDLDWRVIRTAWVYAAAGRNFMLTMLRLFRERGHVRVVADQTGTPTSAPTLARCVWAATLDTGACGVLHFTDAGVASWYDFAMAIYEEARALGLIEREVTIEPIRSDQYPTPARRPSYSVLECSESRARLGQVPVHWRVQLREVLKELRS